LFGLTTLSYYYKDILISLIFSSLAFIFTSSFSSSSSSSRFLLRWHPAISSFVSSSSLPFAVLRYSVFAQVNNSSCSLLLMISLTFSLILSFWSSCVCIIPPSNSYGWRSWKTWLSSLLVVIGEFSISFDISFVWTGVFSWLACIVHWQPNLSRASC